MKQKLSEETFPGGGASSPNKKVYRHVQLFWIIPTGVLIAVLLALLFG